MQNNDRLKFLFNQLLGAVIFMAGVTACYQGAIRHHPWFGPLVVGIIILFDLFTHPQLAGSKLKLLAAVGLLGFITETLLILLRVYSVGPETRWLLPEPLVPLWILALWLNFGIRVPAYIPFFRGRHIINAVTGFVFALIIFSSASAMGLVGLTHKTTSMIICALAWSAIIPVIYLLAGKLFQLKTNTNTVN